MRTIYVQLTKHKVKLLSFLKWLTVPLVFVALYFQLRKELNVIQALELFIDSLSLQTVLFFVIALALMPINLGIESIKWKYVLRNTHTITLLTALQSVFAGISLSIFTPKRIGEYAGRLLIFPEERLKAISPLIVSNLSQSISNIFLGLVSVLFFFFGFSLTSEFQNLSIAIGLSIFFFIALLFFYFRLHLVIDWIGNFSKLRFLLPYIEPIRTFEKKSLFHLLSLSMLKYAIFIIQFVLLIMAFGVEVPFLWAILAASCVFFVKTLLPVPATVELMARGSIALFFFAYISENHIGILVASLLLWVVNLGIPAMLGSIIISRAKML